MGLFFQNIWWYLVLIGVMILIHELGHYWAARFFDVKVETFSFGFGPRLFGEQVDQDAQTRLGLCEIVLRDLAAHSDASPRIEQRKDGVGDRATDVVKVAVDALRAISLERGHVVLGRFIVESRIEAELTHKPSDFFLRARDPDGAASLELCDLSYQRADGAGAPETTTVSPGAGLQISSNPK